MSNYNPDPQLHLYVSFIKSGFRVAAGVFLFLLMFKSAAALLILAELLGVLEECV